MKTVFLASVYSLAALAGLILAIAEEQLFPAVLTVPLAFFALLLNERLKVIRLSVLWSNVLGIGAFVAAAFELAGADTETRVLAGGHLLTYLTWIALFQKKHGRQYWWLLALGVMQVAVSSILTEQGLFGILLAAYVFFGLWTLAVFSVFQAQSGFEHAKLQETGSAEVRDGRTHRHKDQFRSAIQLDPDQRWVSFRFVMGVVTTSFLSLVIGLTFFTVIPRLWVARNPSEFSADPRSRLVTGFTNEIQLGEIGQILESNKPVLQVRCFDREKSGGVPVEIPVAELSTRLGYTEPLFRGSVMGRYKNGRWNVLEESGNVVELLSDRGHQGTRFVQRIILHDGTTNTIFAMHPVRLAEVEPGEELPEIDLVTSILMRPEKARGQEPFEYGLHTYITSRRSQRPGITEVRTAEAFRARRQAFHHFLDLPAGLDAISAVGQEVAASAPVEFNGYQQAEWIAQQIEASLRDSGDFTYSLGAEVVDPSIDPIEDFFRNRKSGHCEYFSSAMALMLRAAGVPSRLVSGFKGGELRNYSGAFVVEERHAHAWVEAFIGNRWRTFDPTPAAARAASVEEIGDERSILAEMGALITGIWHQRIVRLSLGEQRRMIYGPLAERFRDTETSGFMSELWQEVKAFASDPTRWFSVTTFIGTLILAAVLFGLRALWRRLNASDIGLLERIVLAIKDWLEVRRERREQNRVDFYERFTAILAKRGIRRSRTQTPLEFATQAQQYFDEILADTGMTGFPDDLVRRFYDVRYGAAVLEVSEQNSIRELLSRLEQSLAKKNSHLKSSVEA